MKIVSRARQLRLNYEAKIGRRVSVEEVAKAVGVDRKRLTQIELGRMKEIDTDTLAKLCNYYGVGVGDVLEYDPSGYLAALDGQESDGA